MEEGTAQGRQGYFLRRLDGRSDEPYARQCPPEGVHRRSLLSTSHSRRRKYPCLPCACFLQVLMYIDRSLFTLHNRSNYLEPILRIFQPCRRKYLELLCILIHTIFARKDWLLSMQARLLGSKSLQIAESQAATCCPALGGLWGASLAEMKSTAYVDYGAKTQFAP